MSWQVTCVFHLMYLTSYNVLMLPIKLFHKICQLTDTDDAKKQAQV